MRVTTSTNSRNEPHSGPMHLLDELRGTGNVIAVELRAPRAELAAAEGMDAWIDMYHAVRSLARRDVRVFLTDSAVGTQEENNLRHLVTNLGRDVVRDHVIPFLTSKHSLVSLPWTAMRLETRIVYSCWSA